MADWPPVANHSVLQKHTHMRIFFLKKRVTQGMKELKVVFSFAATSKQAELEKDHYNI